MNRESILIDVQYAMRQLKEHRCVDRALDALERVEEALKQDAEEEEEAVEAMYRAYLAECDAAEACR